MKVTAVCLHLLSAILFTLGCNKKYFSSISNSFEILMTSYDTCTWQLSPQVAQQFASSHTRGANRVNFETFLIIIEY